MICPRLDSPVWGGGRTRGLSDPRAHSPSSDAHSPPDLAHSAAGPQGPPGQDVCNRWCTPPAPQASRLEEQQLQRRPTRRPAPPPRLEACRKKEHSGLSLGQLPPPITGEGQV